MCGYLAYSGFKWLKNVDNFDVNLISEKSRIGYILEVNLKYPEELHKLHNDNPLAPEKLAIPYDMLSDYRKKIADEYGIKSDWMKIYIYFNTPNSSEEDFFKLMINSVYGKTIENLRKC